VKVLNKFQILHVLDLTYQKSECFLQHQQALLFLYHTQPEIMEK